MKRQPCPLCKKYAPHFHRERLLKSPPRTVGKAFIFFPSSADLACATRFTVEAHIKYAEKYQDRTFLIQSKAPKFMQAHGFPSNVILGITLETDKRFFFPERGPYAIPLHAITYKDYRDISSAPIPEQRYVEFFDVQHSRKAVTAEPILDFNLHLLSSYIQNLSPEFVYVGYDNHNCKLPEPRLTKTLRLIEKLEKFTEVRRKTLRKAWWEG